MGSSLAWVDHSVSEVLVGTWLPMLVIPALRRWRQAYPWDSLTTCPSLRDKPQNSERETLPQQTKYMVSEEQHLMLPTGFHTHTQTHTLTHTHTGKYTPAHICIHTYVNTHIHSQLTSYAGTLAPTPTPPPSLPLNTEAAFIGSLLLQSGNCPMGSLQ